MKSIFYPVNILLFLKELNTVHIVLLYSPTRLPYIS